MEGPQYGGEEPETFSQSYHKMELIGEGSFGKVYKCRKKGGRDIAAVKFIVKRGKSHKVA
jgi:fused